MRKTYEQHRAELIAEGHREVRPTSIKLEKNSLSNGTESHQITFTITSIPPHSKNNKRGNARRGSETFKEHEFEKVTPRLHHLKGLQIGATKAEIVHEKKTIHFYLQAHYEHRLKEIETNFKLDTEKARSHETIANLVRYKQNIEEYLNRSGVLYFDELNSLNLMDLKPFLLETKKKKGGFQESTPVETLSITSCNKRIDYYNQVISFVKRKHPHVSFTEDVRCSKFTRSDTEMINSYGERKKKVRRIITEDELKNILNNLPWHWVAPFFLLVYTAIRKTRTLLITMDEIDLKNNLIKIPTYKKIEIDGETLISRQKSLHSDLHITAICEELKDFLEIYLPFRNKLEEVLNMKSKFLFFRTRGKKKGLYKKNNDWRTFRQACIDAEIENIEQVDIQGIRKTTLNKIYSTEDQKRLEETQKFAHHAGGSHVTERNYLDDEIIAMLNKRKMDKNKIGFNLTLVKNKYNKALKDFEEGKL